MSIENADTARMTWRDEKQVHLEGTVQEWLAWRATRDKADGLTTGFRAPAYINHSRWVVDCPFCNSAQLASRTDRRFYCIECQNRAVKGRWVAVDWPNEVGTIERLLEQRENVENQNWEPGETVEGLIKENMEHGLKNS